MERDPNLLILFDDNELRSMTDTSTLHSSLMVHNFGQLYEFLSITEIQSTNT